MNRAIIENGGIVITLRAHAVCADCTQFEDYSDDPEGVTLEVFARDATRAFRQSGWSIGGCLGSGKTLCPSCEMSRAKTAARAKAPKGAKS